MSKSEVERFVADLGNQQALHDEFSSRISSIESISAFAKEKGYDIDVDDAREYMEQQASQDLTDDQLDQISGGMRKYIYSTDADGNRTVERNPNWKTVYSPNSHDPSDPNFDF